MATSKDAENSKNEYDLLQVEKPNTDLIEVEYGVDNVLPFATPFQDAANSPSIKEKLYEVGNYDDEDSGPNVFQLQTMRRMDGQVRALYRLITLPIRSALKNATFVPDEGGEAEAEFIDQVFNLPAASGGMTVTMQRFMSQLLNGLYTGFSAFEQVYWQPQFGPLKGKYTLKKLAYRPPETVTFVTTKRGSFAGLRQRTYMAGEVIDIYIPPEKCFYYAAQEEERKFYGISFFQSAFYHYDKKARLYFAAHLAAQRAAVGTRVGTYPVSATPNDRKAFNAKLANLSFAQYMSMPEGFKVEILREGGTFNFLEMIQHHNDAMSKSVLAAFFDQDGGSSGGGEPTIQINNSGPKDDMFLLMLRTIQDDIAAQINNYIIPRLIDWNFASGKYPKFTWGALTDEQKSIISAVFNKLASAQTVTPEFMRETEKTMAKELGFEIDYDKIEEEEEQERQEMAEQQDLEAQQIGAQQSPEEAQAGFRQAAASLSSNGESIVKLAHSFLEEAENGDIQ